MKPRIPMLASALVVAGLAAGAAAHRPSGAPPSHVSGLHFERMIQHLDLTSAQKQAIAELFDARRAGIDARGEQEIAAHEALHQTILVETFDETAIRNAAAAVGALVSDRAVAHATLLNEVRALLTPDQREELEKFLSQPRHPFHGPHPGH